MNTLTDLTISWVHNPHLAQRGHRLDSEYVERFWLPTVGPTAISVLRLVDYLVPEEGLVLGVDELGAMIGLGHLHGTNGPLWRTLVRLHRFGLAHFTEPELVLCRFVAELRIDQIRRLPALLAERHWRRPLLTVTS